ncbi:MAG: hypothetical protein RL748_2475 [Pseudomonadota bacterium]|jgi:hypothetical protein
MPHYKSIFRPVILFSALLTALPPKAFAAPRDIPPEESSNFKQFITTQTLPFPPNWASLSISSNKQGLQAEFDTDIVRSATTVCRARHYRYSKPAINGKSPAWQLDAVVLRAFNANGIRCRDAKDSLMVDEQVSDAMFAWVWKEQALLWKNSGPLIRGNGQCLRVLPCDLALQRIESLPAKDQHAWLALSYLPAANEQRAWCLSSSMRVTYRVEKTDLTPWTTQCSPGHNSK